jgi:hypothetical protein
MKSDIVAYVYQADIYCPRCILAQATNPVEVVFAERAGKDAEAALDLAAQRRGINRSDERSYDSDQFPKVVFEVCGDEEHEHCGECGADLCGAA